MNLMDFNHVEWGWGCPVWSPGDLALPGFARVSAHLLCGLAESRGDLPSAFAHSKLELTSQSRALGPCTACLDLGTSIEGSKLQSLGPFIRIEIEQVVQRHDFDPGASPQAV